VYRESLVSIIHPRVATPLRAVYVTNLPLGHALTQLATHGLEASERVELDPVDGRRGEQRAEEGQPLGGRELRGIEHAGQLAHV
jgi:hypothetical protein